MDPNAQSTDPAAQMLQLLQESAETIQLLANEIQVLRSSSKKEEKKEDKSHSSSDATGQQKTASSIGEISAIFGVPAYKLPNFVKYASTAEASSLKELVEEQARYSTLGKIAEFSDGSSFDSPEERLESQLSSILSR